MESLFLFALLFLVVLVAVVVVAAIRASARRRRGEEAPPEPGTVSLAADTAPGGGAETSAPRDARHEYFMSMGLDAGEEMKIRLYSLDEYEEDLGGDARAARERNFVAALKAYRSVDDEWYGYPPDKAAGALGLAPEDYEADQERGALLLGRLPHGLPASAREVL